MTEQEIQAAITTEPARPYFTVKADNPDVERKVRLLFSTAYSFFNRKENDVKHDVSSMVIKGFLSQVKEDLEGNELEGKIDKFNAFIDMMNTMEGLFDDLRRKHYEQLKAINS